MAAAELDFLSALLVSLLAFLCLAWIGRLFWVATVQLWPRGAAFGPKVHLSASDARFLHDLHIYLESSEWQEPSHKPTRHER